MLDRQSMYSSTGSVQDRSTPVDNVSASATPLNTGLGHDAMCAMIVADLVSSAINSVKLQTKRESLRVRHCESDASSSTPHRSLAPSNGTQFGYYSELASSNPHVFKHDGAGILGLPLCCSYCECPA